MTTFYKKILVVLLPFLIVVFLYRGAIFSTKVAFPSNYLAHFYSPWSTVKFPGWEVGIPNKPIGIDQVRFFYPLRTFTNSEVSKGRLPLWNPYVFSGYPQLANLQSAVFYPLNALYLFLPQIIAWSLLVLFQPILATIFTWLYLRSIKVSYWSALFGGLTFGFSGYITVWSQENAVVGHVALWLPLMLFAVEKVLRGRIRYGILLTLSVSSAIFAGHFQTFFYAFGFLVLYLVYSTVFRSTNKKRTGAILLLAVILGVLIGAVQILPTYEILQQSVRSVTTSGSLLSSYLLPLSHLVKVIAPDLSGNPGAYNFFGSGFYHETVLYIGVAPIIFAFLSMKNILKDRLTIFYVVGLVLSIMLTSNLSLVREIYMNVPIINTFLPSRIFYLSTFCLVVLSAIGLDAVISSSRKRVYFIAGIIISAFLVNILLKENVVGANPVTVRNIFLPLGSVIAVNLSFLVIRKPRIFIGAVFLVTIFNLVYFFNKYQSIGEKQFLYPNNLVFSYLNNSQEDASRFISIGDNAIFEDISIQKKLYSVEGLDPLFPVRYAQLVGATKNNGQIPTDMSRIEATFHEIGNGESMSKNIPRLKLMQILGVSSVLFYQDKDSSENLAEKFPNSLFEKVWQDGRWYGYRYKNALPHPYLVSDYQVVSSPQKIIDAVFSPKNDLSQTVILEEDPGLKAKVNPSDANKTANLTLSKYEPQSVSINVDTKGPTLLVLSDNYYPGWHAFIDGMPTKIYRANYTFRAVSVPPGKHQVNFEYQPQPFFYGALLSLAGLAVLTLVYVLLKKANH